MTQTPFILAVETSGRTGSVAIADGRQVLAEAAFSAPIRHSAELFPAVCGLLSRFNRRPDQIQHVYISVGPGSFTGLRIAVTIAKIMHLANAAKIVAVYTSDCIAANAADYTQAKGKKLEKIATILDAKRGQFFVAVYQNSSGRLVKTLPDCLMTASQFVQKFADANSHKGCPTAEPIWLLGEGLVYYKHLFKAPGIEFLDSSFWSPHATKVHLLGYKMACEGQFADPLTLKPVYLRRPMGLGHALRPEEKWRDS